MYFFLIHLGKLHAQKGMAAEELSFAHNMLIRIASLHTHTRNVYICAAGIKQFIEIEKGFLFSIFLPTYTLMKCITLNMTADLQYAPLINACLHCVNIKFTF